MSFFSNTPTRRTLLAAAFVLSLSGCATTTPSNSLSGVLASDASLSTFADLLTQSGMNDMLRTQGPLTVFAPTNEAFKAMPAATMNDLTKNPEKLKALLSYHIITGKTMAAEIKNSQVKTIGGATVALSKAGDFVTIENAAVVTSDLVAADSVVHTIDMVLTPPKK